jgi:predicted ATPase
MEELGSTQEIAEVRLHEVALAKAIYEKTEGNPFFINQLFTTLHQDGHITLQKKPVPHWVCNMAQIKVYPSTNPVLLLPLLSLNKTSTTLGL